MNYPLVTEYVNAIKSAEDNFDQLTDLRPVLSADGNPVMTGGNFAVVFKMMDGRTGRTSILFSERTVLLILKSKCLFSFFGKMSIITANKGPHQYRGQDSADPDRPQGMKVQQTQDERNAHQRQIEGDLDFAEFEPADIGDRLHGALAGLRHDIGRQVQKDPKSDQGGADDRHSQPDPEIFRCREESEQRVAEGGEVPEHDPHQDLQKILDLKAFPQDQDLQQHQKTMEQDGRLPHLQPPDTGHRIRDGADRRYPEIGLYGHGDAERHDEQAEKVYRKPFFQICIFHG